MLNTKFHKLGGLLLLILLSCLFVWLSIVLGYTKTSWHTAMEAFQNFNGSNEHIIIRESRLPRSIVGMVVGGSLAAAGLLLQAITRNPVASPEFFGINAGAGFFIVVAVTFFGISSIEQFMWLALAGGSLSGIAVYALASAGRGGMTPVKLTLAGAVMAALFASLTQGLLVMNEKALEEVLFWLAGSVEGRKLSMLADVLPFITVGIIGAFLLSRQLNTFLLGDDVAAGLGQKTILQKLLASLCVILLAGGSVAIAGPIGFIGIVIPHFAKFLAGNNHYWLIPYSFLLGGILLNAADILARYVIMPEEVPVGIVTAMIGAPFFIYIARRGHFKG
ncbi:FecCD family ABC transporter permease [Fictibacillus aquaticus]|uniref:FecCD family ABC transporter permease n=1 Tax=Fictibacillus aquaticus TaxID=2021314 RepID=UPI0035E65DE7